MTRIRHLAAAGCAAALLLAGCQDDPGPETGPTGSESAPQESTTPTEPAVEPATGPLVRFKQFQVHLPDGWKVDRKFFTLTYTRDRGSFDLLNISVMSTSATNVTQLARSVLRSSSQELRRVDDSEVAGEPAFHLVGTALRGEHDQYGVIRGGQSIRFMFELDGSKAKRQELIDSVLASIEWR